MKKLAILLIALVLAVGFNGCTQEDVEPIKTLQGSGDDGDR